jgi:hypothetical protein
MKPIHKFNNGRGAMLCNGCRNIISTGPKTEELFCDKCKEDFVKFAIEFNKWVDELRSSEIDTIDYDMYLNNDMDELLEIFKKEKGL